jgi:hypothetical protein
MNTENTDQKRSNVRKESKGVRYADELAGRDARDDHGV